MTWDPKSGRSPLGLPLPEKVGRQHVPELADMAREQGVGRHRGGDVEHVCPECGGGLASGLILVQVCQLCGGTGRLSNDRMSQIFGAGSRSALL